MKAAIDIIDNISDAILAFLMSYAVSLGVLLLLGLG